MKIVIVGTGYVGLVTGVGLALQGHDVVCVDKNAKRIDPINSGKAPFFEPGLDELLGKVARAGRLQASGSLTQALRGADVSIIAVGTPSTGTGIDLSYIRQAARELGEQLRQLDRYHVITVKSTVVPSTTDTVVRHELETASGLKAGEFGLAMNPEFLREGCAVADFNNPDRIVIGQWDERSGGVLQDMYRAFTCPIVRTSLRNAEMIKYTSNALLASLISFSNEVASLCEAVPGLDEAEIMRGVHLDRRWTVKNGSNLPISPEVVHYLRAGIGFGGSCFPKDLQALGYFAEQNGVALPILDAVLKTNRERRDRIIDLLESTLGAIGGRRIAVLGLAFKPDTDDTRELPGMRLADGLARRGAKVTVHDPLVPIEAIRNELPAGVIGVSDIEEAVRDKDAVIIATAWPHYRAWDWNRLGDHMALPLIFDGRQVVDAASLNPRIRLVTIGKTVMNPPRTQDAREATHAFGN